jgi:CTP:molybdopterin cytidylyltransferase MocA
VPLISRQLVALSGAGADEVVVVTGHARTAIERQVQSFSVTLVHNDAYSLGQEGSVRAGLAALKCSFDAVFIMPSDQPLIGAGDLTELIGAFKKRAAGHIVVPIVDGQRGNPILLDESAHEQILASPTNLACRHLIERRPELVSPYETSNTRFISDLDTFEDVEMLVRRTGWQIELPAERETVE